MHAKKYWPEAASYLQPLDAPDQDERTLLCYMMAASASSMCAATTLGFTCWHLRDRSGHCQQHPGLQVLGPDGSHWRCSCQLFVSHVISCSLCFRFSIVPHSPTGKPPNHFRTSFKTGRMRAATCSMKNALVQLKTKLMTYVHVLTHESETHLAKHSRESKAHPAPTSAACTL